MAFVSFHERKPVTVTKAGEFIVGGQGGAGGAAAAGIGMVLCCLIVALPIGLAISSAIIRGAVALSNKIRGAKPGTGGSRRRYRDEDDDRDDDRDDRYERDRYDRYDDGGEVESIPEPSLGWGMLIALVMGAINFLLGMAVGFAVVTLFPPNPQNAWVVQVISNGITIPAGFLIMSGVFTGMLPTTFPRAMLVAVMYHVICLVIGLVIGVIVVALMLALGGFK